MANGRVSIAPLLRTTSRAGCSRCAWLIKTPSRLNDMVWCGLRLPFLALLHHGQSPSSARRTPAWLHTSYGGPPFARRPVFAPLCGSRGSSGALADCRGSSTSLLAQRSIFVPDLTRCAPHDASILSQRTLILLYVVLLQLVAIRSLTTLLLSCAVSVARCASAPKSPQAQSKWAWRSKLGLALEFRSAHPYRLGIPTPTVRTLT